MKLIVTGATGMVGEGALLACIDDPEVEQVVSISRRSCGITHPKVTELLVPDFRDLSTIEDELTGFDGCLYCAGVSSAGMSEADYTVIAYDTPIAFAKTLVRLNPNMVFTHVSGSHTDGTEKGKVMWARVKGKAENALTTLGFKAVYNFRPGLMKPTPGQKHVKTLFRVMLVLYPVITLFTEGIPLRDLGKAMIRSVKSGAPKTVLEIPDIQALARA
jgi:uncharacterized protein YbjT (DUF2867 family)